jgi:hypothetical protein
MTRARILAVAAAMAALTGCGPSVHQDLAIRSYQTDVTLGDRAAQPLPPPPPAVVVPAPGFPAPIALPPLAPTSALVDRPPPPSSPPTEACPKAGPTVFPKDQATQEVAAPPAAGAYGYRQVASSTVAGRTTTLKGGMSRVLASVTSTTDAASQQTIDFTATDRYPGAGSVVSGYQILVGSPQNSTDGIYLTKQEERDAADKVTGTFSPATPVLIMQLPAQGTTSAQGWTSVGNDPVNGIAMELQGKVGKEVRIDACGTVIDAWHVQLTGRIVRSATGLGDASPGTQDDFTTSYDIATQLGGLFAQVNTTVTRTSGATSAWTRHVVQTINSDTPTLVAVQQ